MNASSLCHSLSQIQRRTSEISNALFIRGRNSSIDTNTMNYDVASGVADLLKVMYGEANNGAYMECVSKYVAIIAGQFQPFMKPPEYLDGSDYESRLSSLLGRCIEAHELSPGECIIMGSNGIFLAGKRCDRYEDLISAHVRAKAKERALNVISKRLSQLEEYIFSVSRNKSNGNKPENESVHQALTNAKRVVDLLKSSIFYDFHENENELLPITEIDRRMESPSKYDRYVKKSDKYQSTQPASPSKQDTGRLKLRQILDVGSNIESNKRRVVDLESKICWLLDSFENFQNKINNDKRQLKANTADYGPMNPRSEEKERNDNQSRTLKKKGGSCAIM